MRVAIIGLGLIGGSLGMALIQRGLAEEVIGIDLDEEIIAYGVANQVIHRGTTDLSEGVRGADLVVLAPPVGQIVPLAAALAEHCVNPGQSSTDVGSTRRRLLTSWKRFFRRGFLLSAATRWPARSSREFKALILICLKMRFMC
jgi:prephenate dehydrogenase